jgi:hypothetical protein
MTAIDLALAGKTQEKIAEDLHMSQSTVSRRLRQARISGLLPARTAQRERERPRRMTDAAFLTLAKCPAFLAGLERLARGFAPPYRWRFAMDRADLVQHGLELVLSLPDGMTAAWYLQRIRWTFLEEIRLDPQIEAGNRE